MVALHNQLGSSTLTTGPWCSGRMLMLLATPPVNFPVIPQQVLRLQMPGLLFMQSISSLLSCLQQLCEATVDSGTEAGAHMQACLGVP